MEMLGVEPKSAKSNKIPDLQAYISVPDLAQGMAIVHEHGCRRSVPKRAASRLVSRGS